MTPKAQLTAQDKYQAAHHQLVASALVTQFAHQLDATLKISGSRSFSWFFTTYNVGLLITAAAMVR